MHTAWQIFAVLAIGVIGGCGQLAKGWQSDNPTCTEYQGNTRPFYTQASIVNAATNTNGPFAPNSIMTIYGSHLAFDTAAVSPATITAGMLPTELAPGVRVVIEGHAAGLYYVSPTQINLLIPNSLLPGDALIKVTRDGVTGPCVTVVLGEVAPGIFLNRELLIAATHPDGTVVSPSNPAAAGTWVVLYCAGLGRTAPDLYNNEIALRAMPAVHWADLAVWVEGKPVDPSRIYYAGVTPGYAGLYQINVKLPDEMGRNPEVRVAIGDSISPASVHLAAQ